MFTYELARRLAGTGVTATVLHPGVVRTQFGAEDPTRFFTAMIPLVRPFMKTPARAATSIYLASSPDVEGITGRYFANRKPRQANKAAYDEQTAAHLWQVSAQLTHLDQDQPTHPTPTDPKAHGTVARMGSIYEAAGGMEAMRRLAAAWHERAVTAPIVGHAFGNGFRDDHVERLASYLAEALGGPAAYSQTYGNESSVERLHSGNGEHTEMDNEAIALFIDAVEHSGLPPDQRLREALSAYWAWATRAVMAAHPGSPDDVPEGLAIPRWSWDGPV